ncbi:MAG: VWA domain-containing protein [Deltaproteobacteria bacterium]|nr:VWA domain-containing protein [Deltaproteobacteria bacterium]
MIRPTRLLALLAVLALAVGCSDVPEGGNGANANGGAGGGGGGAGCEGTFCLETDIRIGANPNPLVFTDIDPGASTKQTLNVQHVGSSGDLNVTAFRFEPDDGEFTIPDFAGFTLASSASRELEVHYAPKVAGPRTVLLILTNNSDDTQLREFKVPVQVKQATGTLVIQPNPIDFGPVASGACAEKKVKVYNSGLKALAIAGVQLSPSGSADFTIKTLPELNKSIEPNSSAEVVLEFCPKPGEDNDTTELAVEDSDGKQVTAQVYGAEITPRITIVPPTLVYGSMPLGAKETRSFKIFSQGLAPLEVKSIEVSVLSKVKTLTISKTGPFTLDPDKSELIDVELTASEVLPNDGSAVASLVVTSNDVSKPTINIPVFAKTETGSLKVTPPDLLDFAIVGQGLEVTRKVELFNQGTADVEIKNISITDSSNGEYSIVTDDQFPPVASSPAAHVMKPAEYRSFTVKFKASGPVGQQAKGKLRISSDDPDKPELDIVLVADRAEGSKCAIQLLPNKLNFGVLGYGQSKTLAFTIKNTGTGYCSIDLDPGKADPIKILDCPAGATFPGLPAGKPTCQFIGISSFKTFAPSTKLFNLGPGDTGKLNVFFDAPNEGGLFSDPGSILKKYGFIGLRFKDQATGLAEWYPEDPTDTANVGKYSPNLEAGVGKSAVAVLPDQVDFGLVTIGCKSKVQEASVFNTGITPAYITKVELQGCGVEVDKVAWPGIPKTGLEVTQTVPVKFGLQYAPQNVGKDECQMIITTGVEGTCTNASGQGSTDCQTSADCQSGQTCLGQVFSVPIKGEGTLLDEFTDEFEQGAGKKVDVLFVIDNSGSMGDEQNNLATNFKTFIQVATLWQNDFHLGVVTTDMKAGNQSGRLQGVPRIITHATADPTGKFQANAKVGTNGSADEQGLAAAEAALTLPHVFDAGKACSTDKDCTDGALCVDDPDNPGVKGCGGHNRGFLRKQAGLEIVFVSDEEDSSPGALKYYINFLYSIKGAANKGLFHAHAIVGLQNNSGGSSGGCGAAKGNRYITVANDTGGKTASICDASFATALKNIGEVAFGLSHQFFLTMTAEPATIQVSINGQACPYVKDKTWSYDGNSNSVIFVAETNGGTCMPKQGDKVKIYYKTLCFP